MHNYGLGIHSDNIWPDITTKNTLKYLTTYSADLPNRKYLGDRYAAVAYRSIALLLFLPNKNKPFWDCVIVFGLEKNFIFNIFNYWVTTAAVTA